MTANYNEKPDIQSLTDKRVSIKLKKDETDVTIDMEDAPTREVVEMLVDGEEDLIEFANLDVYDEFLLQEMRKKRVMHFEEDFYSFTMLCYKKDTVKRYKLSDEKLSQSFYFLGMIFFVSNMMLFGMFYNFVDPHSTAYQITAATTLRLMLVRFACGVALHIMLYPEVKKGMLIMKYANNHEDEFVHPHMPFIVGLM